jgi:hypothetical protein
MLSRIVSVLALFTLTLALSYRSAGAQPFCAEDVRKLCPEVPPGGGRIQGCLREHEAELSKECRARLDDLVREAGLLGATCRWDIARLCSDVAPGGARIVSCLEDHAGELSPECRNQLGKGGK